MGNKLIVDSSYWWKDNAWETNLSLILAYWWKENDMSSFTGIVQNTPILKYRNDINSEKDESSHLCKIWNQICRFWQNIPVTKWRTIMTNDSTLSMAHSLVGWLPT